LPCGFFYLSISSFSSPNLSDHRLDVYYTCTYGVALVRISNAGLKCTARGSLEMQDPKIAKIRHLCTIAQICRAMSSQLRKKLLNRNVSPTCPHNLVNFGPLAAEICWRVWGTPPHFNGFLVFAALLHASSGRQPNFAALNRGRHLYSAGRPSRWVLAHILISLWYCTITCVAIATTDSMQCCLFLHMTDIDEIWHGDAVWPS